MSLFGELCCGSCVLYFFFFKQKTAYEMRISDWSSDVCSSDLDVGDRIGPVGDAVVLIAVEEAERRQEAGPDEGAEGGEEQEAAQVHAGDAGQIGRASCRERVCQYV